MTSDLNLNELIAEDCITREFSMMNKATFIIQVLQVFDYNQKVVR